MVVLALAGLLAVAGCDGGIRLESTPYGPGPQPPVPTPCARVSRPPGETSQPPSVTKLAWRSERMRDGSVRMTVGDVDAAPRDPSAMLTTDYRAPDDSGDCYGVRIVTVRGWWCATTVSPVAESGPIVVGGAAPQAHVRSAGFRSHCSGRTARMRQAYQIQRDSWSGWRSYDDWGYTGWTTRQDQTGPAVTALCPRGRVGTYDYRLAVSVEVDGIQVQPSSASSPTIRTDCGTGTS